MVKKIEWEGHQINQFIDCCHGFIIVYNPDSETDYPYEASWKTGGFSGVFKTLDSAKMWCQDVIDRWTKQKSH